ncbi:Hypothetical protein LUCI_2018 [Lucifera butyrica]|uniref:Zinc-ribbon domain-containing protein n=1 Tax=Lucifera butyrica TaxID=1351585 RepID=A0A498R937_9FIRM|nr:hypothetical protein [Lucifera butyrica]VBB06782.1 Hypothetical protein LUCI_2018 [Lucifera butyrica]
MYCSYCGRKIIYNGVYCRYCGNRVRDRMEDTQPLPAVRDSFSGEPGPGKGLFSLNKPLAARQPMRHLSHSLYLLVSVVLLLTITYVLVEFKTVQQYRILTAIVGSLTVLALWWKSK